MGLRAMRGRWQYRFRIHGQDVCETTGLAATESNRTKALEREAAHKLRIQEGRWNAQRLKPRSFAAALPEFLAWCKVEYKAEASWRRIETSMTSAEVFFAKAVVSMITPGDVERYKVWRLTPRKEIVNGKEREVRPVKPVTAKHDLDNLSVFFSWAVKNDYARNNPVKDVDRPSDADAIRQRILTTAEEKLYFSNTTGNLFKVARLILLQGLRPEEALRIEKADVDLERGLLHVRRGKTRAAKRTLKLTQEAASILAGQMQTHSKWAFPSDKIPGRHITKLNCPHDRVCAKIKLPFVLYDLRHTFATRLAEAGVDSFAIAAILGHSSNRVLHRYVHPTQHHQDAAMALIDARNEAQRGSTRPQ